jgi:hypothetical protein
MCEAFSSEVDTGSREENAIGKSERQHLTPALAIWSVSP